MPQMPGSRRCRGRVLQSCILRLCREFSRGASTCFQSPHGSAHGGVVYAEIIGDLLHGVDPGLEGPGHGLAAVGIAAGKVPEWFGERSALGAWHLARPPGGQGRSAVALHERLTAEEDLMPQAFPNAWLYNPPRGRRPGVSHVARESVRGLLPPDGLAPWRQPLSPRYAPLRERLRHGFAATQLLGLRHSASPIGEWSEVGREGPVAPAEISGAPQGETVCGRSPRNVRFLESSPSCRLGGQRRQCVQTRR
jgi:hypothetical protein